MPSWQEKPTGSAAQFRGLDAVSRDVAWLGGSDGSLDSVECARDGACWASGAAWRVARLAPRR